MCEKISYLIRKLFVFLILITMVVTSIPSVLVEAAAAVQNQTATALEDSKEESDAKGKEIDTQTYKDLGLKVANTDEEMDKVYNDEENLASSPFGSDESERLNLFTAREVYLASNGTKGNVYTVRDGFDTIDDRCEQDGSINKEGGNLEGAYKYYGISQKVSSDYGHKDSSKVSSNTNNTLAKKDNGFYGIYATSTEFNGGEGKDNYIAELRAYGNTSTTSFGGKDYKGRIAVKIFKIASNGDRTSIQELEVGHNESMFVNDTMRYMNRMYIQELDAMFEIKAADINGDGRDELLVYAGRYQDKDGKRYASVDVYQSSGYGGFSRSGSIEVNCGAARYFYENDDWHYGLRKVPVVTMAAGDLEKDNDHTEDVIVTVSAPTDHANVKEAARAVVFAAPKGGSAADLKPVKGLEDISLGKSDDVLAMVSANCAFGQFELPETDLMGNVFFIGGYQTNNATSNRDSGTYKKGALKYVYYDSEAEKYVISDYLVQELGKTALKIADSYKNAKSGHWRPNHAPLPLACGDLYGTNQMTDDKGNVINYDALLFGGDIYYRSLENMMPGVDQALGEAVHNLSLTTAQRNHNNNNKDKEQVWIGDIRVGDIDKNAKEHAWRDSFLYVVGVHRDEKVNGSDDYYWMDLGTCTYAKKQFRSTQEGVVTESNRRNDQYGTFISLSLPDIDNDSVYAKFKEKYLVHTNPVVYAVLQSAPYFGDLNESVGYVNNGETAIGQSSGSGTSDGFGVSLAVGPYVSAEASLFGAAEAEVEIKVYGSYGYDSATNVDYAVSYSNNSGGDDQAVVLCNSFIYYDYDCYDPETGKMESLIMPVCVGTETNIIDVEEYDKIAEKTEGLDPIRGNVLFNTPGEPSTYAKLPKGEKKYASKKTSQVSASSGSSQSQEIEVTKESSHSMEIGIEINSKAGAGAGFLGNDVIAGLSSTNNDHYVKEWTSSNGTTYSGTVDDTPTENNNYTFKWKMLVNTCKLNGQDTWVVGYKVSDVVRPPHMPSGLTVTGVGKNSVSLAWEQVKDADYYALYIVDAAGNYNFVQNIENSEADCDVTGLVSNHSYRFAMRSVNTKSGKSIFTPVVSATTRADDTRFSITEQPKDVTAYGGSDAEFSATGVFKADDGTERTVRYEWQIKKNDSWKTLDHETSSLLRLKNVTDDMSGNEYRCRVYCMEMTLYTQSATLTVDRLSSKTALSIFNETQNTDITADENNIVAAGGSVPQYEIRTVYGDKEILVKDTDSRLSLYNYENEYLWYDGTDYYKNKLDLTNAFDQDEERSKQIDKDFVFPTDKAELLGDKCYYSFNSTDAQIITITVDDFGNTKENVTTYAGITRMSEDNLKKFDAKELKFVSGNESFEGTEILRGWEDGTNLFFEVTGILKETSDSGEATEQEVTLGIYKVLGDSSCVECEIIEEKDIVINGMSVSDADLSVVKQTTAKEQKVLVETKEYDGDVLVLTADLTGDAGQIDGDVTFTINGPTNEIINAVRNEDGTYSAKWTPGKDGTYDISARFTGDHRYYGSRSKAITIHTVYEQQILDLDTEAGTLAYGDDTGLEFTCVTKAGNDFSKKDITLDQDAAYTVQIAETTFVKGEPVKKYKDAAEGTDYVISNGRFEPHKVAEFRINGTYNDQSASADLKVEKGEITISAADTVRNIMDSKERRAEFESEKIEGLTPWDQNDAAFNLEKDTDYELKSAGTTATQLGDYDLKVNYKAIDDEDYTEKVAQVLKSYEISFENATYTLEAEKYEVSVDAVNPHGNPGIVYRNAKDSGIETEMGTKATLQEGFYVTVNAKPFSGYQIKSWKKIVEKDGVKEERLVINSAGETGQSTDVPYTGNAIVIEKLAGNENYIVEYAAIYHKLTFEAAADADGIAHGKVKGNYLSRGSVGDAIANGSNVHEIQSVRLTAAPDKGYKVASWTVITKDASGKEVTDVIKTADTMKDFTGLTSDTKVIVEFAAMEQYSLTLSAVVDNADGAGNAKKITVPFKVISTKDGVETELKANDKGTYQLQYGDNVTAEVTVPKGYLADRWTDQNGKTIKDTSNDSTTISLINIGKDGITDKAFTVHFVSPNHYEVTYAADQTAGVSLTARMVGSEVAVASGTTVAQGSDIEFTAVPKEGYEIAGWTVNGQSVKGEAIKGSDSQKYVLSDIREAADVKVTLRQVTSITKAAVTISDTLTYNGQAQMPKAVTVEVGGKTLVYNVDYTLKATDNRNAGTAALQVTGIGSYKDTVTKQFTILPKEAAVTVDNKSKETRKADPVFTYNVTGLVEGEQLTVTLTRTKGEDPGTYQITAAVSDNPNYKVTVNNGTLTIAEPKIDKTVMSNKLNEGLHVAWKGSSLKVEWGKAAYADGYEVYAAQCTKALPTRPTAVVKDVNKTSVTLKKISGKAVSSSKEYKMYIKAYRIVKGTKTYIGESFPMHTAGAKQKDVTNAKAIRVAKNRYTLNLNRKQTAKVTYTVTKEQRGKQLINHATLARIRFFSMDKNIAKVSPTGKITPVGKGKTNIYVMASNGVKAKVTVTVK